VGFAGRPILRFPRIATVWFSILGIAIESRRSHDASGRRFEAEQRLPRTQRSFRVVQEADAVERPHPFGIKFEQLRKQPLLPEPGDRGDLQVRLAEELLVVEAQPFGELFPAHRQEQLADP
jgi:hypothetical protein